MPHRTTFLLSLFCYVLAALLTAALDMGVVSQAMAAQRAPTTSVTILIRDLDGVPVVGVALTVVDANGEAWVVATDDQGRAEVAIDGPSLWLREAAGPEGAALEMDSNNAGGGLVLLVDGTPLILGFMLDGPLLFRAPAVLDNPAFPEGELLAQETPLATPTAPMLAGTSVVLATPDSAPDTDVPAGEIPVALLLMLGVMGLALLLILVVWLRQVWRYRQAQGRRQR